MPNPLEIKNFSYGLVTVQMSKGLLAVTYAGNMGADDTKVVEGVAGLIKKYKNVPEMNVVAKVFRNRKPSRVEGAPDYWWYESYKLTKKDRVINA